MIYQMTTFTTQYSPVEDRILLLTQLSDGRQAKLSLTRRLLVLLLPKLDQALLKHYEKQASLPAEALAAENTANRSQKSEGGGEKKPVEAPAHVPLTLIAGASIHPSETGLILALSTEANVAPHSEFRVALTFENLHSWLSIVRGLADKVDWSLAAATPVEAAPDEGEPKPKAGWH